MVRVIPNQSAYVPLDQPRRDVDDTLLEDTPAACRKTHAEFKNKNSPPPRTRKFCVFPTGVQPTNTHWSRQMRKSRGPLHGVCYVLGMALGLVSAVRSNETPSSPSSLRENCRTVFVDLESVKTTLWYSNVFCVCLSVIVIILLSLMMCFPRILVKCVDGNGEMLRRQWAEMARAKNETGESHRTQPRRYSKRQTTRNSSAVRKVLRTAEVHKDAHDKSMLLKKRLSAQRLQKRLAARSQIKNLTSQSNTLSSDVIRSGATGSVVAKPPVVRIKSSW